MKFLISAILLAASVLADKEKESFKTKRSLIDLTNDNGGHGLSLGGGSSGGFGDGHEYLEVGSIEILDDHSGISTAGSSIGGSSGIGGGGDEGRITHITLFKEVNVAHPIPVPVKVIKKVPVAVKVPVPFKVDRPFPVHVPKPYPVAIDKPYPVKVYKNIPVPVKVPYKVGVPVKVPVHVAKPVAVPVHKPVAIPVPDIRVIKKLVPVIVEGNGNDGGLGSDYLSGDYGSLGGSHISFTSGSDFGEHEIISSGESYSVGGSGRNYKHH